MMFSVNWGWRDWDLSLALSGLILSQKLTDKKYLTSQTINPTNNDGWTALMHAVKKTTVFIV